MYEDLFKRNRGVFTREDQERLKESRVLILGCGGIGGTVATILARTGVGKFRLVDFDRYESSNTNRQICCTAETLGEYKAKAVGDHIKAINPEAEVEIWTEKLSMEETDELMEGTDLVFPAADDFAYSCFSARLARKRGIPALIVVPTGTWAAVTIVDKNSPSPEVLGGSPEFETQQELRSFMEEGAYRIGASFYPTLANWQRDYFEDFLEGTMPPAQICPVVWTASSIGAMESIKALTGRWKPATLPNIWHLSDSRVRRINLYRPGILQAGLTIRRIRLRRFAKMDSEARAKFIEKHKKARQKLSCRA